VQSSSKIIAIINQHPVFFTGRMPFLLPNQQCQSTEGKMGNKLMRKLVMKRQRQLSYSCHWVHYGRFTLVDLSANKSTGVNSPLGSCRFDSPSLLIPILCSASNQRHRPKTMCIILDVISKGKKVKVVDLYSVSTRSVSLRRSGIARNVQG